MTSIARMLSLAFLLVSVSFAAEARTRHVDQSVEPFDRHAVEIGSRMFISEAGARRVKTTGLKQIRKRQHKRGATRPVRGPATAQHSGSPHLLVASSGAKTSVSTVARPKFTCLLGKLEAAGYHIDFMGGYAGRGNSSAHPTGNALDINQTARNVVTRRLPPNATEMARDCGLVHGAVWSNPDQGHFEMPKKYGYIYRHRRTRYAAAR